jgi:hypothetical protein
MAWRLGRQLRAAGAVAAGSERAGSASTVAGAAPRDEAGR